MLKIERCRENPELQNVWLTINGEFRVKKQVRVLKRIYVNSRIVEPTGQVAVSNKRLPRNKPKFHLYEYKINNKFYTENKKVIEAKFVS